MAVERTGGFLERNSFTAGNYDAQLDFSSIHPDPGIPSNIPYSTSGTNPTEGFVARQGDFAGNMGGMYYKKDPNEDSSSNNDRAGEQSVKDQNAPSLKVFPNPSRGRFEIVLEAENSNDMEIYIFDGTGKQVFQREYNSHRVVPNLSLAPGFYILRVTNADNTFTEQLIVQ